MARVSGISRLGLVLVLVSEHCSNVAISIMFSRLGGLEL